MSEWKPKPKADARTEDMSLTGEEGFVLSRVDGSTSLKSLVAVTGLPEGRVRQILQKLVRQGAVEDGASAEPPALPGGNRGPGLTGDTPGPAPGPTLPPTNEAASMTAVDELSPQEMRELLTMDDELGATESAAPTASTSVPAQVLLPTEPEAQIDEPPDDDDKDKGASGTLTDDASSSEGEEGARQASDDVEEANYRKLYNVELSKLEPPEREAMARAGQDPQLLALCFDPLHAVIRGIFENSRAGMPHARMVARNHHTPQGLDVIIARAEFFRDAQVQRSLLANTMLQEPQLKKLLQPKRLLDVYKVSTSREIPERNRQKARHVLRSKWATADGDERAGLVFTTEGRCLLQLTGLPFDSQTTTYLCQKTYNSVLLIQNLARFGATPPQVLLHLMRQPAVKRQQHLRQLIKQHPNCPADAKRQA